MTVEEVIENALAHHGVKGMRWGFRGSRVTASYVGRVKAGHNVNRKIARGEGTIGDKLLTGSFTKSVAARNADNQAAMVHRIETGQKKALDYVAIAAQTNVRDLAAGFSQKQLDRNLALTDKFVNKRLAKTKLSTLREAKANAVHSDEVMEFLAHHGVKGQRWGIRRAKAHIDAVNAESRKPKAVAVKTNPTKKRKKIETSGGENQPAHADAVSARSKQQVLKKSGLDSLSNKDLQEVQTRLNLEANVSRLDKAQRLSGEHFVVRFLKDPKGRKQLSSAATSDEAKAVGKVLKGSPVGVRAARKITKTAVKVGLAAA